MAQGFKVADAYVEVHVEDDTKKGRQQVERDTSRWANKLGLNLGRSVGAGLLSGIGKAMMMVLSGLFQITKWMAIAAAVGAVVQGVAALGVALVQLAGLTPLVAPAILGLISIFGALKIAFSGFATALQAGWAGDAEKFAEAMKKLHPEMQKVLQTIIKLKPQLEAFKKAIQGEFFKGLASDIQVLAAVYLPLLQNHLAGVASLFNQLAHEVIRLFTTREFLADWGTTLEAVRRTLANVLAGIPAVLDGFRHIGTVAAPILQQLTAGFGAWAQRFADAMERMRADGSLEDFIRKGIKAATDLIDIMVNLARIISPIFRALADPTIIDAMVRITGQLADLLNTAEAMSVITAFFGALSDILKALGPGVVAILTALGKSLLILAPALTALGSAVSQGLILLGPTLELAAGYIGQIVVGLTPVLPILARALGELVEILGPALVRLAPILVGLFEAAADAVGPLAEIVAELVLAAGPSLIDFLDAIARALIALLPAAQPVGQALGAIITALVPLLPLIGSVGALLLTGLASALTAIAKVITPLLSVWVQFWSAFAELMTPQLLSAVDKMTPALTAMLLAISTNLAPLLPLLSQVLTILVEQVIAWLPAFVDLFTQMVPLVQQFAYEFGVVLLKALTAFLPYLPQLIPVFFHLVIALLQLAIAVIPLLPILVQLLNIWIEATIRSGAFTASMIGLQAILWTVIIVINVLTAVVRAVVGVIQWAANNIVDFWRGIWDTIQKLWGLLSGFPDRIKSVFGSFVNSLYSIGQNMVVGLWNGIASMGSWLWNRVMQFAKNNIPGPIAWALGIGSPSKVAAELAKWIPIGLAKGIDDNRQIVVDAATRLAMAAMPALAVPLAPMPAGYSADTSTASGSGKSDVYILADFGDGVRQLVRGVITDEPELVASSTDEGRRTRGFAYSPRAKV